jgi:hypothetical protein
MSLSTMTVIEEYSANKTFRHKVDGLFALVAEHLEGFAASHSLQLHRWYHDAPIWILSQEEKGIMRNIHVGPTSDVSTGEVGLGVAVDAYQAEATLPQRKSLKSGRVMGQVTEAGLREDSGQLVDLLEKAYQRGKRIKEKDLA